MMSDGFITKFMIQPLPFMANFITDIDSRFLFKLYVMEFFEYFSWNQHKNNTYDLYVEGEKMFYQYFLSIKRMSIHELKGILVSKELIFNNRVKIVIDIGLKSEKILNSLAAKNFILKTFQWMVLPKLSIKQD